MGLNRMMFIKKTATSGGAVFTMTMGQQYYQYYGYSRYNGNYGEVEGNVKYEGKTVTLVMVSYYGSYLDFAFNVEGVTGGKYNVTLKVTSVETGESIRVEFPDIQYQSYVPGFYEYTNTLPSNVSSMFTAANVGKKFKIEIVFN